jgi:hypothetical protein
MIHRILCLFGIHDPETVYPLLGRVLHYKKCKHCPRVWDVVMK